MPTFLGRPLTEEEIKEVQDQLPRYVVMSAKCQIWARANGIDVNKVPAPEIVARYKAAINDLTNITTINFWVQNALVLATGSGQRKRWEKRLKELRGEEKANGRTT